jgi:putative transposase
MMYSYNSLLQWHDHDSCWLERVLWVDPVGEDVLCLRIEKSDPDQESWPFLRSKTALNQAFENQEARSLEKDPFLKPPVDPKKLSKEKAERWEKNLRAVQAVIDNPLIIFDRKQWRVSYAARESGLNRRTVYRLLWKIWKGGQTPQCVLPDYKECGGKKRNFKGGKKRGRRNALEIEADKKIGLVITEKLEGLIRRGIKRHYNKSQGLTLKQSYLNLLADEFCSGAELVNGVWIPTLKSNEELPSQRQVEYIFYKYRDPEHEKQAREGENSLVLTGRAITGNTETQVFGPGSIGQMDATTADIYLRSEHNPDLIVGRPTIYVIKDAWGKFLYAVTATFERPSYWGAAIALENALVNKAEYCAQYGITIPWYEWPVNFLPAKLIVDRGEMSTYKTDHLVTGLGIGIITLPPRRGDLKGTVERHFGLLNNQIIKWLPGALPRFEGRPQKRHELDAVLTISEFRRMLIEATLKYHRALLAEYKLASDLITAGVEARPIELLRWGIENRSGLMRTFPLNEARFHLLPHGEARLTEKGVFFKGVYYTCERAVREKWFERARSYGRRTMEIAFDPRRVDSLYFQPSKSMVIEELVLTIPDRRFSGWTWEEIEDNAKNGQLLSQEAKHQELQDQIQLIATRRHISKTAEVRQKAAADANPDQSQASQLGNISENRNAEKLSDRKSSLQNASPPNPTDVKEIVPDNVIQLNGDSARPKIVQIPPAKSRFHEKQRALLDRAHKK